MRTTKKRKKTKVLGREEPKWSIQSKKKKKLGPKSKCGKEESQEDPLVS